MSDSSSWPVVPSRVDDVSKILLLLEDVRADLHEREIDQWRNPIPANVVEADVLRGELFLVRGAGELHAVVTVTESDEALWGTSDCSALYVHRIAVHPRLHGRGLGTKILDWVVAYAGARAKRSIRLDCAQENQRLRRYYEDHGFVHVRDAVAGSPHSPREFRVSLYQREVGAG